MLTSAVRPTGRQSKPTKFNPMSRKSDPPSPAPQNAKAKVKLDHQDSDLLQKQVLRQFRIVFNAVKTHFRQVEKDIGIGGAQLWALSLIHDQQGIGTGDLARLMDIHQSTASNLVRALVAQNLVNTSKSETDRRAVVLSVQPAAIKLLRKAPAPFSGVLPDALARMDQTTLRRLDKDLGQVIAALEADERAANTPLGQL